MVVFLADDRRMGQILLFQADLDGPSLSVRGLQGLGVC